jgi:hypothetical protein
MSRLSNCKSDVPCPRRKEKAPTTPDLSRLILITMPPSPGEGRALTLKFLDNRSLPEENGKRSSWVDTDNQRLGYTVASSSKEGEEEMYERRA